MVIYLLPDFPVDAGLQDTWATLLSWGFEVIVARFLFEELIVESLRSSYGY